MSEISEKPSADGKKNKRSISARIAKAVFTGCFVLGIVLLMISVTTYIYELSRSQISTAFNLSVSAREIVNRNVDASIFAEQVMDVYYGMTDEERSKVGTDEYYEKFEEIGRDYGYRQLKMILSDFRNTSYMRAIWQASQKVRGVSVAIWSRLSARLRNSAFFSGVSAFSASSRARAA